MIDANSGHAPSYGTDHWTLLAEKALNELFASDVKSFFIYNGTAANVAALRALTRPWHSVLCSDVAHLALDECGAPEYLAGLKLQTIPANDGKITVAGLKSALVRRGDQHHSQARVVSLTQPTELGTCYSAEEIGTICRWAHSEKLLVHIDGARIANAVVSQNSSFHKMLVETGVDVLSFGGTKNGLADGEVVVFLQPELAADFRYLRKQMAQLPSKTRFLSAPFTEYLATGLWHQIASHSLAQAKLLEEAVRGIPRVKITRPVQSNVVFAQIPQSWVAPLREKYFFYVWDEKSFECRWMTSFDTEKSDIDGFAQALRELAKESAP
jgi:threonine aldolase